MDSTKSAKSFKTQCCLPITSPRPEKLELCALGMTPLSQWSILQQRKCRKMKFPAFPLSKSNWHNWFGFFNFCFFIFIFTQKKILNFFSFSFLSSNLHYSFLKKYKHTLYAVSYIETNTNNSKQNKSPIQPMRIGSQIWKQ